MQPQQTRTGRQRSYCLPGSVCLATQQLQKDLLIWNACWIKRKLVFNSFLLLHLLATTEQNHQDHVFCWCKSKQGFKKYISVAEFGSSMIFYCLFNPFPVDSNVAVDRGKTVLLKTISKIHNIAPRIYFKGWGGGGGGSIPQKNWLSTSGPARWVARAVTGRQCPQWGGARLFAASEGHPHENGRNSETKSQKIDPRCQIDRLSKGYKRAIDEIRGPMEKNGFSGRKPKILSKKSVHFLRLTMFRPRPGNVVQRKKVPFSQMINRE